MRFKEFSNLPLLDAVLITVDGTTFELLEEGKTINGRFSRNIRLDQPTHGVGQTHAHVMGRKGDELVVVNIDGSGSHGTKGRLSKGDADALRNKGFKINASNIVEWFAVNDSIKMLLE